MVVFRLFENLRYSNERSTKFESLYQEYKEENGKMVALQISLKIELLYGLGRQATKLCMKFCMKFCMEFCKAPIWTIFG